MSGIIPLVAGNKVGYLRKYVNDHKDGILVLLGPFQA